MMIFSSCFWSTDVTLECFCRSPSTTSNSGSRRSIATPVKTSTSCWLETSVTSQQRRWWIIQQLRWGHTHISLFLVLFCIVPEMTDGFDCCNENNVVIFTAPASFLSHINCCAQATTKIPKSWTLWNVYSHILWIVKATVQWQSCFYRVSVRLEQRWFLV